MRFAISLCSLALITGTADADLRVGDDALSPASRIPPTRLEGPLGHTPTPPTPQPPPAELGTVERVVGILGLVGFGVAYLGGKASAKPGRHSARSTRRRASLALAPTADGFRGGVSLRW